MPGVFRPYTLTDVLGAIASQNGQQTVDTVTNGVGYFAETDESLTPQPGLLYRAAPATFQSAASVDTFPVAKQPGTVAGDWIFIYLFGTDVQSGVACTGFTVVQDNGPYGAFLYRLADGSEGADFLITGLGNQAVSAVIATIGGGQTTLDPPSVGSLSTSGPSTSLAVSSISLANSGDWVLWFAGNENGFTNVSYAIMPPASFTPRATNGAQTANPCVMVADNQSLPSGATGAQTGTCSTPSFWSGVMVGLTPAPTVPSLADDVSATVQAPAGWDNGEWNQFTWEAFVQDYMGVFGDGSDGPVVFDGTSTVLGLVPSGGKYTMNRDIFCTAITINSAATLQPHGYRIFCTGQVVNNGLIKDNGPSASGTNQSTGGGSTGSGSFSSGRGGANGGTGAGVGPGGASCIGTFAAGGAGSNGAGGTQSSATSLANAINFLRNVDPALGGTFIIFSTTVLFAIAGGCSGGGDGTNNGGGGGAAGAVIAIFAPTVVNNGTIEANAGNGGTPTTGNCGGGGGGTGGLILIYTLSAWTPGTVSVNGGAAGSGVGTGVAGTAGTVGQVLNVVLV